MSGFKTTTTIIMLVVFIGIVALHYKGIIPTWGAIAAAVATVVTIWIVSYNARK